MLKLGKNIFLSATETRSRGGFAFFKHVKGSGNGNASNRVRRSFSWSLIAVLVISFTILQGAPLRAANCTMTEDGNGDVIIKVAETGCTIPAGTYNITRDFVIESGVSVTAGSDNGTGTGVVINVGRDIDIQGSLSANGQGYTSGDPGVGTNDYAGAGHGGNGGDNAGDGGSTYGNVSSPLTIGSRGRGGALGGGAIKLSAVSTLTVDGTISANGNNSSNSNRRGGGSGGSIWLDAASLAGSGTVIADGGDGPGAGWSGGGGGGGRIAVLYTDDYSTLISGDKIQAVGGDGKGSGITSGGAGTIFIDDTDDADAHGSLLVDNGNWSDSDDTTQYDDGATNHVFDSITVRDGAKYVIPNGLGLELASGGALTGGGTQQSSVTVDAGAVLDLNQASAAVIGMDIVNDGTFASATALTLNDSTFYHNASLPATVTAVTVESGGNFVPTTLSGLSLSTLTIESGGYFEQRMLGAVPVTTVTVTSGGTLRHTDNGSSKVYELYLDATDIDIQSGATVTVSGRGFSSGGSGAGSNSYAGAGYGGNGGDNAGNGGATYGSVTLPTDLGSKGYSGGDGGGAVRLVATGTLTVDGDIYANGSNASCSSGRSGGSGGSVLLQADTLDGDGNVYANGGEGAGCGYSGGGGGGGRIAVHYATDNSTLISDGNKLDAFGGDGKGGGITSGGAGTVYWDDTDDLLPNGNLLVSNNNDSDGDNTTQYNDPSADQTYDTITVKNAAKYVIPSAHSLTLASGGTWTGGGSQQSSVTVDAGGSLNLNMAAMSLSGTDIVNNGTFASATSLTLNDATFYHNGSLPATVTAVTAEAGGNFVPSTTSGLSLATLTVESGGYFEQRMLGALPVTTVTVESGGTLFHTTNGSSKIYELYLDATDIDLQSGSTVNVNGRGHSSGGSGAAPASYKGAGHGGVGGENGGGTYGSVKEPDTLGSRGYGGGTGGGAVRLVASGTLTMNGTISANGNDPGCSNGRSGGSGGSIWLDAATLAGAGSLSANGGDGPGCGWYGPGSGGGRIAIYYTNDTSSIISGQSFTANGGDGKYSYDSGGGGTIFWDDEDDSLPNGSLLVSNNRTDGNPTRQVAGSTVTVDYLNIKDYADYEVPDTAILALSSGATLDSSGASPSLTVDSGGTINLNDAVISSDLDFTNNGNLGLSGDMVVETGGDFRTAGTITGGLTSLTVQDTATFIHASDDQLFSGSDLIVESGGTFIQENTVTMDVDTVWIKSGGTLTHCDNSTSKTCVIDISATTVTIDGTVDVDGLGFDASEGDGAGGDGAAAGGGGHADTGGEGYDSSVAQANGGDAYGTADNPTTLGSGGGNDTGGGAGGDGGGHVKIVASGTMTIDGTITANGVSASTNQAGGGAGGSIWLSADTWAGSSGTITASGGSGAGNDTDGGGCGSEGYIDFDYTTKTYTGSEPEAEVGCAGPRSEFSLVCGDSNIDPGEQCEDSNGLDGDGCSASCQISVDGYGSSHAITIDSDYVDSDLYGFPVLLSDRSFAYDVYANTQASGADLLFTADEAGTEPLPFEVVSWDTGASTAEVWVKVASVASAVDTTIYVWYDNASAAAPLAGADNGAWSVWSDYEAVWHLDESVTDEQTSATHYDSTSAGHHGTQHNNDDEAAQIGSGQRFDGSSDWIDFTDFDIGDDWTISMWANPYSSSTGQAFLGKHSSSGGNLVLLGYYGSGHYFNVRDSTYSESAATTGMRYLSVHGEASGANTDVTYYRNGTELWQSTLSETAGDVSGKAWTLGQGWDSSNRSDYLNGTLDEVRIASTARSEAWQSTEYSNQSDPNSFLHVCGNGVVTGTEQCDDGNQDDGDGCTNQCSAVVPPSVTPAVSPVSPNVYDVVTLSAGATDDSGVVEIRLYLDGTDAEDLVRVCGFGSGQTPVSCSAGLGQLSDGAHTLYAVATDDEAGETQESLAFSVAGVTTDNSMTLSRLAAGAIEVGFDLSFTINGADTGTLTVTFPAGFEVTQAFQSGTCSGGGTIDSFTFDALHLYGEKNSCAGTVALSGAQVTNPLTTGSYTIEWSNDNGSGDVYITDDDNVSVTSNVDPTLTFDLDVSVIDADSDDPYAVDLGTLSTSGPSGSDGTIPSIWIDLSTNATGGATVTVSSLYQALRSASNPSDEIASATATLTGGTEGYGICVASATGTQDGGDTFAAQGNYAGTCTAGSYDVGALPADATPANLLIADGPISAGRSQVRVGASMSTATPAHPDYTDILTFLATGTF
jgi:cysteine-rich repeat protein